MGKFSRYSYNKVNKGIAAHENLNGIYTKFQHSIFMWYIRKQFKLDIKFNKDIIFA